jgi:3D (Asp-Asp-Asp) domain-containing protein
MKNLLVLLTLLCLPSVIAGTSCSDLADEYTAKESSASSWESVKVVELSRTDAIVQEAPPVIVPDNSGLTVVSASPASPTRPTPKTVLVRVTGYCPCARCCGRMTGITSTGSTAWVPGVAADPTWLKPGTVVEVPGYGKYAIDDKGGKLKRRWWRNGVPRLDVRFQYHWQGKEWGEQFLEVKVYPPAK